MLEDRDYMRQPVYHTPRVSFTVLLLIVNAIVFIVECVCCGYPPKFLETNYFALSLYGIKHGYIWQLLTFQFMHASILHILFNSWAIFLFGRQIEARLGPKKFLALYLAGGVVGGLFQMLGAFIWPVHFGNAVVGASAGGMALIATFAVFYSEDSITTFVYFFPITMRAKYFLWAIISLSMLCILFPHSLFNLILGRNVANGAHLGGILVGFLYARYMSNGNWIAPFPSAPRERKIFRRAPKKPDVDLSAEEYLQKEVDPILEKISAHGIQSLTTREREILEKARTKMNRR